MAEELTIFKAVNSVAERQRLFTKLLAAQGNLYLKDKFDRSLPLKATEIDSRFYMKCVTPAKSVQLSTDDSYTATFWIDREKYMFETRVKYEDGVLFLPVMALFHLQKRRTFRYIVPPDFSSEFFIKTLNEKECALPCRMTDVSIQGCAVEVHHQDVELKLEDIVQAELRFGGREPITVQGVIKNIRVKDFENLVLGVEFHHMIHLSEEDIMLAISDLQRDLFFKQAG